MPNRRFHRTLLALAALFLFAACDRLPPVAPDSAAPGVDLSDPDVGGGAGEATGPQTPVPPASPTNEASPRLDATAAAGIPTALPSPTPLPEPTALPPTATPTGSPESTVEPAATATAEAPPVTPTPEASSIPPTATPGGEAESSSETIHVVQPGENLYRIGLQYGLSWVVIAEYNGITDPNAIVVGQELRIPPTTPTPAATATQTAGDGQQTTDDAPQAAEAEPDDPDGSAAVELADAADEPPTSGPETEPPLAVTVAPGDTVYAIAQRHGISWDQVAEANGLAAPNQIYVGQVLKIPADAPGPTPDFTHQVHRGETLTGIAQQYGLSPDTLAEANGLAAPFVIYPGQGLVIPGE